MPIDSAIAPFLADLFDQQPGNVIWYQPVRDSASQELITDFLVGYINPKALQTIGDRYQGTVGTSIRYSNKQDSSLAEERFNQIRQVLENGTPIEIEYYNDHIGQQFFIQLSRAAGGVLSVSRQTVIPAVVKQESERQHALLEGVLRTSASIMVVYDAIRDAAGGTIQDFRFAVVNPMAHQEITKLFGKNPVGRTLLEINPDSKESGLFYDCLRVIETGIPFRKDHFNAQLDIWYDTAITKLGDGCVVTVNDITGQKQAALEREKQTQFLNSVLDASPNGIVALRAVRNGDGIVVDFIIVSANKRAAEILKTTVEGLVGKSDLTIHPSLRASGVFDVYVKTVETGEPQQIEAHYDDTRIEFWPAVATRKISDDELVVTFSDMSSMKRTQQELERTKVNLQAVIDNSQTGIFVFSPVYDEAGQVIDFRFKVINRMVAALIGQVPTVILGDLASSWFISYRDTDTFERYKVTLATGEEQRFDTNYNVDGLDVWFDVRSVKLGDDVLVTFTDYTSLKQAQQAVERQADLLNSVLNSSWNGIASFEAIRDETGRIVDFRFITINQASEQIVGIPIETMMKGTMASIFPGNWEVGMFDMYVKTTETGEPTRQEFYVKTDGVDSWLDISARKLGDGFVVTFSDITLLKQAGRAIEQSAAELQTIIDIAQVGIFLLEPIFDAAGTVVDFRFRIANQWLALYVGLDSSSVIGQLGSRIFPAYKQNGLFDAYRNTYVTGQFARFDFHYREDGVNAWLDIKSTKVGDEVLVTFTDFTQLKHLQQELESSVTDLQRSNKNLEQFAYVASHDLQEPLRKIQSFGDLLHAQYSSVMDAGGADMIRRMQSAAARMQVLITDVLAYSRITTRRETFYPVDLNQVVGGVLNDLETSIAEKKATLTVETLPIIQGDEAQLRQLFQNLISNALKFTKPAPADAIITLTARQSAGRAVRGMPVSGNDADRLFHVIEVVDNGIGFDPEQSERIFQVFQRLHSRSAYQGTGIGLAVVQKVIDNHQGYIRAAGQPGQGAIFTILLPV